MAWFRGRLRNATEGAVEDLFKFVIKWVALGSVLVIALLVLIAADSPPWAITAIAVGSFFWLFWRHLEVSKRQERLVSELATVEAKVTANEAQIRALEKSMAIAGYFAELFTALLDTVQKVSHGALDVSLDDLVERGILEPARELLRHSGGDVRIIRLASSPTA
jgi:hypothetical protein